MRHSAKRRLSTGHAGWAEGLCAPPRRFHDTVLRLFLNPQLGPRLFVITGEAATRPRSVFKWWLYKFMLVVFMKRLKTSSRGLGWRFRKMRPGFSKSLISK